MVGAAARSAKSGEVARGVGGEESNGDEASLRVEVATVAAAEEGESDGEGVSPMLGTGVEEGVVSGGDRY